MQPLKELLKAMFEEYHESGLQKVKFHLFDYLVKDVERFARLEM